MRTCELLRRLAVCDLLSWCSYDLCYVEAGQTALFAADALGATLAVIEQHIASAPVLEAAASLMEVTAHARWCAAVCWLTLARDTDPSTANRCFGFPWQATASNHRAGRCAITNSRWRVPAANVLLLQTRTT